MKNKFFLFAPIPSFKQLGLTLFFSGCLSLACSQTTWQDMMADPTANFFEIQAAFEAEMGDQPYEKGKGIKQFRRWEYYWESRVDENGNFPAEGHVLNEMEMYLQTHPTDRGYVAGSGTWQPMGPYGIPLNGTGQLNGNGRTTCIQFHPTDPNIMYAGAASGGFWRSDDGGNNWTEYSTGMVRLGVSSIVVDPLSPNVIYIGTGDRDGGDAPGYGVWRSIDGGVSWSAHNNGMGNRTINELLMDPNDPTIMVAAASNGRIFRTTDAGANWTQSAALGMNPKDIAMHPTNSSIVYAGGDEVHRSTDGGVTWTQITSGVPSAQRIALAVSPDEPNWVYLLAGNGGGLVGVYRSTDSGLNYSLRTNTPNIFDYDTDGSGGSSQAWYDNVIAADPTDANIIYTGAINIWKSTDGGLNMNCVSYWVGQSGPIEGVHADQHVLEFSPFNNDLFSGNDGGIYVTSNGGTNWLDVSNGLGIAQIYKIGVSQQTEDLVINGYQDNGTAIFDNGIFTTEIGGDGMECIIDPTNDQYMYGALYYGAIRRSTNGGLNFSNIANSISENGGWVTPYKLDPNNSNTMLAGFDNVWRNDDVQGSTSWTQISSFGGTQNIRDIGMSPSNSDIVYISRYDNTFRRCDNATSGSPTWTNLTSGLPVSNEPKDIEVDPNDPSHVFMCIGNNIYESTNSGVSWTDVSGTLPNISLNTIVIDHNSSVGAMYVGMDVGVYYKDDNLSDWVIYNSGLANVEVTELEIHYGASCGGFLYAATYGQGLWKSDLKDPGNVAPTACFDVSTYALCESEILYITDLSSFGPTSWTWSISPGTFVYTGGTDANSQNPEVQFTAPGVYDIQLTATNGNGSDVLNKTSIVTVSGAVAACSMADDFESYSLCGTANNCGTTNCTIGSNWTNLANGTEDDIDWRLDEDGTASNNTGPTTDFNPGTTTGNYIYLEASGGCTGQEAILESTCILLDQDYNFTFQYHMYGANMGTLHLDLFSGGAWVNDIMTQISGDQGNSWQLASVDLSAFSGQAIRLRLRGETGGDYDSDLALDDFNFAPLPNGPVSLSSCGSMNSPGGNQTWTTTGTYTDTLTANSGCDSLVIYDVQINSANTGSETVSSCDNYTWPANGALYTSSGVFNTTLTNVAGCDSVVTLNLTINNASSATETVSTCDNYTWPADGNSYSSSGMYTTTLTNSQGCDSVITLDLTLGTSYSFNETATSCVDYTWPVNGTNYTTTGIYTEVYTGSTGCDSTYTLDLTILANSNIVETVSSCDTYTWPATGLDYSASGMYTTTLTSQLGCDSVVTLDLTIETVDVSTSLAGSTITATASGATYAWMDCGDMVLVAGETAQSFTPSISGLYAVVVNQNGCVDTSACVEVDLTTGVLENSFGHAILIYPNPTEGLLTIDLTNAYEDIEVVITDAAGKIVQSFWVNNQQVVSFELTEAKGIYFVRIISGDETAVLKVLKK